MMSYEEMDLAVAAEVFGASLEESLALCGISLEEFYEDLIPMPTAEDLLEAWWEG